MIKDLNGKITSKENEMFNLKKNNLDIQKDLTEIKFKYDKLIKDNKNDNETLKDKLSQKEKDILQLSNKIKENNEKYDVLLNNEKYDVLLKDKEQLKNELGEKILELKEKNEEIRNENNSMLRELQNKLLGKDLELTDLQNKNKKIQDSTEELNLKIEKIKDENLKLKLELEEKENKLGKIKNELENNSKKSLDLLNEIISLKEKYNDLLNSNEKLKIENIQKEQEIIKLTNSSKTESDSKSDALQTIHDLNLKITNNLVMLNTKENEIKTLKLNNNELKNSSEKYQKDLIEKEKNIESLNKKIKEKENEIEKYSSKYIDLQNNFKELNIKYSNTLSENNDLKKNNIKLRGDNDKNEFTSNDINLKINLVNKTLNKIFNQFQKYQNEIEKIQKEIDKNQKSGEQINISGLNKLLDLNDNEIGDDAKNTINKTFSQCLSNINEKITSTSSKFKILCNLYYNGVNNINKLFKDKNDIKESLSLNNNKILELLNSENSVQELKEISNIYQKKLNNKNIKIGELINLSFKISDDAINSLLEISQDKDNEIKRLNNRISSFLQEIEIIKKSNESQAKDNSKAAQMQKTQLQNELKIKGEEINKIQKTLIENKKQITNLNSKLSQTTQNYALTGKYFIMQYLENVSKFSQELYKYTEENKKEKK